MKIYDISQELFGSCVFPGDEAPKWRRTMETEKGDVCNLTVLSMCAHNGTHIDAPYHFCAEGKTIDEIPLQMVIGKAKVVAFDGELSREDAAGIMADRPEKVLLKGRAIVTPEAAKCFTGYGIQLIGVESQTVGPEDSPMDVHLELLGHGAVLLEGIRLAHVPEGYYMLNAAPVNLGGADGAPCRAVLIEMQDSQI